MVDNSEKQDFIERVNGRPLGPERANFIMGKIREQEDVNWRKCDDAIKKIKLAIEAAVFCDIKNPGRFEKDLELISEQYPFAA